MTNKSPKLPQKPIDDDWMEPGDMPEIPAVQLPPQGWSMPVNNPTFAVPPGMAQRSSNPLTKYFRSPGLAIRLPTGGHYNPGEIDFEVNGEISIFPMTAGDEMFFKNPDALMNGAAIEKVISSCAPAIRNVRDLPTTDVDAILLAIRAATYGDAMQYEAKCPHCGENNEFSTSIRVCLETANAVETDNAVRLADDLVAYVRPHTFRNQTKLSLATFEEAKRYQLAEQEENDEKKSKMIGESCDRIASLNFDLMSACVERIVMPDGEVTDRKFIIEFLRNCPRSMYKLIEVGLMKINEGGVNKRKAQACASCGKEWETEVNFDPTHFFE